MAWELRVLAALVEYFALVHNTHMASNLEPHVMPVPSLTTSHWASTSCKCNTHTHQINNLKEKSTENQGSYHGA